MLVIYHEYHLQDADVKLSKFLPCASWIESNIEVMSKTGALLAAAKDRKIAFHEERTARPQNNAPSSYSSLPGSDAVPAAAKERTTRPQNNSHHSSLPGTDAVPAAAKGKTALPPKFPLYSSLSGTSALPATAKGKTALPPKIPLYSSLPGTSALPATTKGKTALPPKIPPYSSLSGTSALPAAAKDQKIAKEKKKRRPQNNNSNYTRNPGYQTDGYGYIVSGVGDGYEWGMCDKDCGWCGRC